MHVAGVSLAKVWSIVVITAVGVMALGLVLHRTFDHGAAGDRTEAQIEARDQAARDRAVAAGRAAERQASFTTAAVAIAHRGSSD